MATRYETPDVTVECECGAELYFRVTYEIYPGERETRDCPGSDPGIEAIEIEAETEHCSECGRSTEPAEVRLFTILDKNDDKAWYMVHADVHLDDGRW